MDNLSPLYNYLLRKQANYQSNKNLNLLITEFIKSSFID